MPNGVVQICLIITNNLCVKVLFLFVELVIGLPWVQQVACIHLGSMAYCVLDIFPGLILLNTEVLGHAKPFLKPSIHE